MNSVKIMLFVILLASIKAKKDDNKKMHVIRSKEFSITESERKLSVTESERKLSVNGIMDFALVLLRKRLVKDGYEPMALPDYEASFLHLGLLGKLKLTNCQLHNISTIYRSQDVNYNKTNSGINVITALSFHNVQVKCTYKASLLTILNKKGKLVISLPNLSAQIDLNLIVSKLKIQLNNLDLFHNGIIDVHLEGGLLDAVGSILTETVSNLFKNVILYQVEKQIEDKVRDILDGNKKDIQVLLEKSRTSSIFQQKLNGA